jgi:phospholipid/cholesterol/gamma-HCH transport system permease protein
MKGAEARPAFITQSGSLLILAWLGRVVGARLRFVLRLMALSTGIVVEALSRTSWHRTVRWEFSRVLGAALTGCLPAIIFVASLVGIGMVYQSIFWLRVAGEEGLIGKVLVLVVLREVAPVLVGIVLLGRGASAMLAELSQLNSEHQLHAMQTQGIDPFQLLVMPRGVSFALAAFTLGMVFMVITLLSGFVIANLLGIMQNSIWYFLDTVLRAASPSDFIVFPLKLLVIGLLIGATSCLTALSAAPDARVGQLISRGFIRGMLAVLLTSGILSVVS